MEIKIIGFTVENEYTKWELEHANGGVSLSTRIKSNGITWSHDLVFRTPQDIDQFCAALQSLKWGLKNATS